MRSSLALAGLLLCLSTASDAQEEVAPERIERIKAKMADNLRRLPNYTCTETIERYMRGPRSRIFAPLDTLRLEVALVDGNELFAAAGAGKFEEKDIWEIVGDDAAIGNGDFALLASNVFLSQQPVFTQVGETTLNGSPAIRYDYRVARELSGYRIRIKSRQTTVGYHGSFWVQPDTLDLIRLEAHADSIPPDLDLAEASHALEYHPVRIGEADFLLPQISELAMIDRAGNENRNRTDLDSCRRYIAESAIRFVPPVPAAKPRQSPAVAVAKTGRRCFASCAKAAARGDPPSSPHQSPSRGKPAAPPQLHLHRDHRAHPAPAWLEKIPTPRHSPPGGGAGGRERAVLLARRRQV